MNRRLALTLVSLLLTAGLVSAPLQAAPMPVTRDWAQYPAIVSIAAPKELYALGDVHGDYDRLMQLLVAGKIVDALPASPQTPHWAAGKAVLVCTGDMIDKYDHSLEVVTIMKTLQSQANAAGGRLIVTLGNHEAEFLAANGQDKKASEFSRQLETAGISPEDVASGSDPLGIGVWLRNLPAGAKVGDWFFCHAGNTGGLSLADLDKTIQQQITAQGWGAPILADPNSMLEARMHPRPWWDWDGSEPQLKDVEKPKKEAKADKATGAAGEESRLLKTVEALGARHLVFGHQPGKMKFLDGTERGEGEMYGKYNGLVFMIDTGMSRGVQSGRGALLLIEPLKSHPTATALYADGTKSVLWQ
jgi:hypothetical protein